MYFYTKKEKKGEIMKNLKEHYSPLVLTIVTIIISTTGTGFILALLYSKTNKTNLVSIITEDYKIFQNENIIYTLTKNGFFCGVIIVSIYLLIILLLFPEFFVQKNKNKKAK